MKLKSLSVFFPAYNEEANIANTVEQALKVIPGIAEEYEIIVVNDGSSDRTEQVIKELSGRYPQVKYITHQKNRGYGAALKTGFRNSAFEYIFFTDADGQFDIAEIVKLTSLIKDCNIVAGIRAKRSDPFHRIINAKAYNILVRILFGLKVTDIDCAFKLIRKKVFDSLELKSESQFVSAEFLIRASKKGHKILQCPVTHLARHKGRPTGDSPKAVISAFKELFILWKELK